MEGIMPYLRKKLLYMHYVTMRRYILTNLTSVKENDKKMRSLLFYGLVLTFLLYIMPIKVVLFS